MPPRGRKNPDLFAPEGEAGPQISIEETELEHLDEPGAESAGLPTLMYDGDLLQTSMTLAVVLPGDSKESYFGARFVGRCQPHEQAEDISARAITVVRESVIGQMDDAIDSLIEYQKALHASGRLDR